MKKNTYNISKFSPVVTCADLCGDYEEEYKPPINKNKEDIVHKIEKDAESEVRMREITKEKLMEILENHKHWLEKDCDNWENMRADLSCANLRHANLRHANLSNTNKSVISVRMILFAS